MSRKNIFLITTSVVVISAIAILGGTGFQIGDKPIAQIFNKKSACDIKPKAREFKQKPYYSGPLIDAHVHMPTPSKIVGSVAGRFGFAMPVLGGNLTIDYITCLFESEGIKKAVGFYIVPRFADGIVARAVKKYEKQHPGKIAAFFMPPPINFLNLGIDTIKDIFTKHKGLFKGVGELRGDFENAQNLESPYFEALFKMAEQNNQIVMIHPNRRQRDVVEGLLEKYPKITFLFHGGREEEWVADIFDKYDNFYYSLDANLVPLYGWNREHISDEPTKEEFLAYFRENFNARLGREVDRWKWKIEAHPERFVWGTDRWYEWHFDLEVGGLLEEFGRSFIGRLSGVAKENFAYKNAERMLGGR